VGEEGMKVVVVMVFGCKKNVAGEVSGAEKNREIWPCTVYWIDRNEETRGHPSPRTVSSIARTPSIFI
jgi:hypothetical protein